MSRWLAPLDALGRLNISQGARREIERVVASTPVPLAPSYGRNFFGWTGGAAGYKTYLDTYGTDAVVYPIVARLAESMRNSQWGLWTKSVSGSDEDRTAVKSHAVLDLLDHPNDFQTFGEILEAAQQHFELVGENDIILGFAGGISIPIDMWVLRPDRLAPIPDDENFLAGWVYSSPAGGEKIPLETRELLRIVRPSPVDPYRGMGPIQALLRDLDSQRYSREWQAAFFENSARPSGVISIEDELRDSQFNQLRERWAEQHKGVSKAHRVAILEYGAKWIETQFSLKDMQIAELETVSRDKALVAFGMPKSVVGIVEDVNRANAEAGQYLFAEYMIKPRLMRWREMLNTRLLPLYGKNVARSLELDFVDPVPENGEQQMVELKTKSEVLVSLLSIGSAKFDVEKVLDMLDWPDLGYEYVEPPAPVLPAAPGGKPGEDGKPMTPGDVSRASGFTDVGQAEWDSPTIDAAMRWKVVGHPDTSCCDPCMKNLGKLYRNRSAAYADYPGGKAYIKCVGEQYGNHCRCRVIKRRDGR